MFIRYPKYKDNYIKTFDKMIARKIETGKSVDKQWQTGESVFNWWLKN